MLGPSSGSPLWLRLCLSFLSALGPCSFSAPHHLFFALPQALFHHRFAVHQPTTWRTCRFLELLWAATFYSCSFHHRLQTPQQLQTSTSQLSKTCFSLGSFSVDLVWKVPPERNLGCWGAHVCFPSLRNESSVLPVVQKLKTYFLHMYSYFFLEKLV